MYLTTEPSLAGKNYNALRIIFATVTSYDEGKPGDGWDAAIENALGKLYAKATKLGADAVIGVHLSTAVEGLNGNVVVTTVMGTAIKFI